MTLIDAMLFVGVLWIPGPYQVPHPSLLFAFAVGAVAVAASRRWETWMVALAIPILAFNWSGNIVWVLGPRSWHWDSCLCASGPLVCLLVYRWNGRLRRLRYSDAF